MQDNPDGRRHSAAAQSLCVLRGVDHMIGNRLVLRDIDLEIVEGAPTVLMGPNGAGKTTLLRLLMGLIEPSRGAITFAPLPGGAPVRRAIVFQKPIMLRRSAAANLAFARRAAGLSADERTIGSLLDLVGLGTLAGAPARRLSGGEQQRLALARALALEPALLLLDEPTANLDPAQTKAVEEIIARVAASGVKIVMATHDIGEARRLAGEVVFLAGGRLREQTPARDFFEAARTEEARRFLAGDLVI